MPAAVFVVRSTVADPAKRTAFDQWYQNELLPDAVTSFRVKKAWRFWSLTDPAIHQATYYFDDEAALDRAMKEEVPRLIAKFVRDWPDVPRIRETRRRSPGIRALPRRSMRAACTRSQFMRPVTAWSPTCSARGSRASISIATDCKVGLIAKSAICR
jgi:hypothetical protein